MVEEKLYVVETQAISKITYIFRSNTAPNGIVQILIDGGLEESHQEWLGEKVVGIFEINEERIKKFKNPKVINLCDENKDDINEEVPKNDIETR